MGNDGLYRFVQGNRNLKNGLDKSIERIREAIEPFAGQAAREKNKKEKEKYYLYLLRDSGFIRLAKDRCLFT